MGRTLRPALVAGTLIATSTLLAAPTLASQTMLVLHSISHDSRVHCLTPQNQGYFNAATQTVTSAPANTDIDVFVYLAGYYQAEAVAFKMVWPADWHYYGWTGDCLGHPLTITDVVGNSINVAMAFDVLTGGALAPIGFASFTSGMSGETAIEGTRYCQSGGICYVDNQTEVAIDQGMTGRVAVGGAGFNPASSNGFGIATWGSLKSRYR